MLGAYLLELFEVTPTGEPQDAGKFGNLWKATRNFRDMQLLALRFFRYGFDSRCSAA